MDKDTQPPREDARLYDVLAHDPAARTAVLGPLGADDVDQISDLLQAMSELREAERIASQASARYMELNETDMRALRFLIFSEKRGVPVTAGDLASHLGISTASTTKLLDRLQSGGHITRNPHPTDRRALQISVTPETRRSAHETVGRHHARRYHTAARLTPAERDIVIRFLRDMADEIDIKNADWIPHD